MILVIQSSSNIDCLFLFGPSYRRNSEANEIHFFLAKYIYTQQKKLRKMCSSAYYNKSIKVLEIQTSESYKVTFDLSNETLFELIAPGVAWKIIVKVD